MRDIAVTLIVLSCCIAALRKPYIGFLCWIWLSLMNPHRLTFGFASQMPFAMLTIVSTIIGTLAEPNKNKFFQHGLVVLQVLLLLWTGLTTAAAIFPEHSLLGFNKFAKIMLGVFLSYLLINSKEKLNGLLSAIFISVGFFGVKGGIFTIVTLGNNRVWGPDDSFIADNNALACALLMIMPIGMYLLSITRSKNLQKVIIACLGLMGISTLGSNSRGAFLGLIAVGAFWISKAPGKQKMLALLLVGFVGTIAVSFMPDSYWNRMNTIKTYEQDGSAMGRINAWWCAFNLAMDRFTGAGFDYASPYVFSLYAPVPEDLHTAHSIYFQILGDHGFVGLGLFLIIILWEWLLLGKIVKTTHNYQELKWANLLARMLQLSLIAYTVCGAFLSLTYYDLFWQLLACVILLNTHLKSTQKLTQENLNNNTSVIPKLKSFVKSYKRPIQPL